MRSSGVFAGESGVLFMDMIAEIRRRHLVSKESISSIARDLKLSRPTVRKHCRTQSEPVYQRRQAADADAGRVPGDAGDLAAHRTPAARKRSAAPPVGCSRACRSRGIAVPTTACSGSCSAGRRAKSGPALTQAFVPLGVCARRGLPVRLEPRACRTRLASCRPSRSRISG